MPLLMIPTMTSTVAVQFLVYFMGLSKSGQSKLFYDKHFRIDKSREFSKI